VKHKSSLDTQALREFAENLRGRRTINLFLQTQIPQQLVLDAIETASWAPNHHLTEPWHFYLLGPRSKEQCLDLCHQIVADKKGAAAADFKRRSWSEKPGWLVVTCRRSEREITQNEDHAACSAAVQNLMLYLWKAGIGSKWTSGDIIRDARFHSIVGIEPADEFVVGLVWYGYPKLTPTQSRKAVHEICTILR
jgi:nitroreductase